MWFSKEAYSINKSASLLPKSLSLSCLCSLYVPSVSHAQYKCTICLTLLRKETTNRMIPLTDFFRDFEIQKKLSTNSLIKEQDLIKGTDRFRFFHKDKCESWYAGRGLSRDFVYFVNKCRPNLYSLNGSLVRIDFIIDGVCQYEAESHDLSHVFRQCPCYDDERRRRRILLSMLLKRKLCLPLCISSSFCSLNTESLKHIDNFLKQCSVRI